MGGGNVRNYCVLELADLRFEGVPAVEENDLLAGFLLGINEFVEFLGLQVLSAAHDAVFVNLQLPRSSKAYDLVPDLDAHPGEVVRSAVRPFHVDAAESPVFPCGLDILLDRFDFAAHGGVDAVFGNEDARGQPELLAEGTLPEHDGVGVGDGGKAVKKHDSVQSHAFKGTGSPQTAGMRMRGRWTGPETEGRGVAACPPITIA